MEVDITEFRVYIEIFSFFHFSLFFFPLSIPISDLGMLKNIMSRGIETSWPRHLELWR